MTDIQNDWRAGEWGVGVIALEHHDNDRIGRVVVACQPDTATWSEQRDLAQELQRSCTQSGFKEVVWITPEGLMCFLAPHHEKDLPGIGEAVAAMIPPIRFDQSALMDENVEARRRQGRYEPQPVAGMPVYWWWLADPESGKVIVGPDQAAPTVDQESVWDARERVHLPDAQLGYVYPRSSTEPWRVTTIDHDAVEDHHLARRVAAAAEREAARLLGPSPPQ